MYGFPIINILVFMKNPERHEYVVNYLLINYKSL